MEISRAMMSSAYKQAFFLVMKDGVGFCPRVHD